MTDSSGPGPTPPGQEPVPPTQQEPDSSPAAADPGYLIVTGEAAAEDGSVAEIIGGLPAVEGSAWDIGAPAADRGGDVPDERDRPPGQARER